MRLGFGEDDLDGEAMSGDMTQLQLTYAHLGDRFVNVVTASYFSKEFDAVNPVFDKTRDDDGYGLAYFVFDTGLFDSKDWWGQASIGWIEQDSNIDFYDQGVASVILGVQRNF